MSFLRGLSPITRALALVVLLTALGSAYWKTRLAPLRAQTLRCERDLGSLHKDIRQARQRVEALRREAAANRRWADYAHVLAEQSTGKSLRDLLTTCGSSAGPEVAVRNLHFDRGKARHGFRDIGVSFHLEGRYDELIRLLHQLDQAFPPVEFTGIELKVPDQATPGEKHWVSAEMKGVVHEPL
jgi:hypothetical protein